MSGRVVLDEKIWIELPLVSDHDIVLMPGQTIPLTVFQPSTISMLRNLITKDKTFGVRLVINPFILPPPHTQYFVLAQQFLLLQLYIYYVDHLSISSVMNCILDQPDI